MAEKKIVLEIRKRIADAVHEVINEFNAVVGKKLKKSTETHAKKISEKYAKTAKKLDRKVKKATTAKKGKSTGKVKKRAVSTIQLSKAIPGSPAAPKAAAKKEGSTAGKSRAKAKSKGGKEK